MTERREEWPTSMPRDLLVVAAASAADASSGKVAAAPSDMAVERELVAAD